MSAHLPARRRDVPRSVDIEDVRFLATDPSVFWTRDGTCYCSDPGDVAWTVKVAQAYELLGSLRMLSI